MCASPGLAVGVAEQPAEQDQVLERGEVLIDGRELSGQAHSAAYRGGLAHDIVTEHPRDARVRAQQRGKDADGGGLAGAIGSEYAVDAALRNREVDTVECPCGAKPLRQCVRLDREFAGNVVCRSNHPLECSSVRPNGQVNWTSQTANSGDERARARLAADARARARLAADARAADGSR